MVKHTTTIRTVHVEHTPFFGILIGCKLITWFANIGVYNSDSPLVWHSSFESRCVKLYLKASKYTEEYSWKDFFFLKNKNNYFEHKPLEKKIENHFFGKLLSFYAKHLYNKRLFCNFIWIAVTVPFDCVIRPQGKKLLWGCEIFLSKLIRNRFIIRFHLSDY